MVKKCRKLYYQHKKMYYDKTTETWTQREDTSSSATKDVDTVMNDFCFSDDSDGIQTSDEY